MSDRIAEPSGVRVDRKSSAVGEDFSKKVESLVENHDLARTLNHLPRHRRGVDLGHPLRQTIRVRLFLSAATVLALIEDFEGGRAHGHFFMIRGEIDGQVDQILSVGIPQAG